MAAAQRRAAVTLLTNDAFAPGAEALLRSLARHGELPRDVATITLVTPAVTAATRRRLAKFCQEVREVAPLPNPFATACHVQSWADAGFTKLRLWDLHQDFDLVLYLDADCIVQGPLGDLFERDVGDAGFAAAPDVFPPDRFNAGVLLLRPCESTFGRLLREVKRVENGELDALVSYDGGDTGFLNAMFPQWFALPEGNRLPFAYNAQRLVHAMARGNLGYWNAIKPLKVVHFSSSPKPWESTQERAELDLLWWDEYLGGSSPLSSLLGA